MVAAIKGRQGRYAKGKIVAVASFVLTFAFAGVYDMLYGGGTPRSTDSSGSDAVSTGDARGKGDATIKGDAKSRSNAARYEGKVAPGLEEVARRWSSSDIRSPLFVPSHLPSPVREVDMNFTASGIAPLLYEITTADGKVALWTSGRNGSETNNPSTPGVRTLVLKDGRSYYYVVRRKPPMLGGGLQVIFWGEDTFFFNLQTEPNATEAELVSILELMVRVESKATRDD